MYVKQKVFLPIKPSLLDEPAGDRENLIEFDKKSFLLLRHNFSK